jgi:hypothetical protein
MNTGQVQTQQNQLPDPTESAVRSVLDNLNPMEENTQQGIEGSRGYQNKSGFVGSVLIFCISRGWFPAVS